MGNFILFTNKGTGLGLLKLLVENNKTPRLVLTQTPYDSINSKRNISTFFILLRYLLSRVIYRNNYRKLYDVYYFCKENNIEVISERYTNSSRLIERCNKLNINIGIIFTYGIILKKDIIQSFSKGIINFHPSLLPKHRGLDPVFWTIYDGDKYSGITFHYIDEHIDKGIIIYQKKYKIKESETVFSLTNELIKMGEEEILFFLKNKRFRESDINNIGVDIMDTYEKKVPNNFFCIDENTNSEKIRKLFKLQLFNYKPYILIENKKIEFDNYEIIFKDYELDLNNSFILKKSDDYIEIKTYDNKIIKLYK